MDGRGPLTNRMGHFLLEFQLFAIWATSKMALLENTNTKRLISLEANELVVGLLKLK